MPTKTIRWIVCIAIALPIAAAARDDDDHRRGERSRQIEPDAGQWRTWVISSGKDLRVAPPPRARDTRAELKTLVELTRHRTASDESQIAFWNAGAPAYRWLDMVHSRLQG